jgi:hypothetical protein
VRNQDVWIESRKVFERLSKDACIGFLHGALDDEVFEPKNDTWMQLSEKELRDLCCDCYILAAKQILQGRVFKSENQPAHKIH